ncbi:dihydrolipoyllysine-residue succinyltransferase component of 2-oxoglutarate dehydrogenase complex, putative [Plasmodium relictum]|uniref:dihydrolipoyllysine-residue succinyltransferase n=1 Tax=Plasmodium relictum TaxID=85471 RepID=A0A1J1HEH7_PLARL|nr:dihydrolipoyllysine-residue succinyltransferase component of 2-oxoglutarate dehydrogenase complex, putative [Plasmodium relictum]CRH02458.1 dihydrolipoyllysine-residue succinyltransferase component of 2-oxoglutarate dehydrogenase complex, putative [Plasmodium relictum]
MQIFIIFRRYIIIINILIHNILLNFSLDTIKVPRLGDSITEGTINEWKKKVGDYVKEDETIAIIDTDKVSVDINSKSKGVLHKVFAEVGDVVLVDTPLCEIDTSVLPSDNVSSTKKKESESTTKKVEIDTIKVPRLGDSITEGTINEWKKKVGDYVKEDETIAIIDTDKVSVDIKSKSNGVLHKVFAEVGDVVLVDSPLCEIDTSVLPSDNVSSTKKKENESIKKKVEKEEQKINSESLSDVKKTEYNVTEGKKTEYNVNEEKKNEKNVNEKKIIETNYEYGNERIEKRVRMLPIRKRIAERLKESQNTCALLTTFNECDMSKAMIFRSELKDIFQKKYGCKLGFVSLFIYASTLALKKMPQVNAFIEKDEIVYKNYIDISVAVATPNGLTVPVIRDCQNKKLPQIEQALSELATKARSNKLSLDDFTGGTFTISNGGVFGSMLSTPIVNMPQSAILGMHTIKNRPVVVNNEIVIRPIMYLALTYDHRLLDGRDAVQFLCAIRDYIENPNLMLIDY